MARPDYLEGSVMPWPITDFDGVTFNDGRGWQEIQAIHLAIKERADLTGHTLGSGDYSDPWDTDTPVFLSGPGNSDGRIYLRDQLETFYDDVADLVEGDPKIRWTKTSGRSDEWTTASLVTDIGLGDFADLLTKPQNHLPFLWLHEALDRLIYTKRTTQAQTPGRLYWHDSYGGLGASEQLAWTSMFTDTPSHGQSGTPAIYWAVGPAGPFSWSGYGSIIVDGRLDIPIRIFPAMTGGLITDMDHNLWHEDRGFTGTNVIIRIGTEIQNFNAGTFPAETVAFEGVPGDVDILGTETLLDMSFVTAWPTTVPFSPVSGPTANRIYFEYLNSSAYVDLGAELTDQA